MSSIDSQETLAHVEASAVMYVCMYLSIYVRNVCMCALSLSVCLSVCLSHSLWFALILSLYISPSLILSLSLSICLSSLSLSLAVYLSLSLLFLFVYHLVCFSLSFSLFFPSVPCRRKFGIHSLFGVVWIPEHVMLSYWDPKARNMLGDFLQASLSCLTNSINRLTYLGRPQQRNTMLCWGHYSREASYRRIF